MKTCTRFHFSDVEPGDRIFLSEGRTREASDVTVTVARAFRTNNFGPVIEGTDHKTYYLHDYDIVRTAT